MSLAEESVHSEGHPEGLTAPRPDVYCHPLLYNTAVAALKILMGQCPVRLATHPWELGITKYN